MKQLNLFANIVHTIEVNGFHIKGAGNGVYEAAIWGDGDLAETMQAFFDMHGRIRIKVSNGAEERTFTVAYSERYPTVTFQYAMGGSDALTSELARAVRTHGERK